jgi:hypothetical protein
MCVVSHGSVLEYIDVGTERVSHEMPYLVSNWIRTRIKVCHMLWHHLHRSIVTVRNVWLIREMLYLWHMFICSWYIDVGNECINREMLFLVWNPMRTQTVCHVRRICIRVYWYCGTDWTEAQMRDEKQYVSVTRTVTCSAHYACLIDVFYLLGRQFP